VASYTRPTVCALHPKSETLALGGLCFWDFATVTLMPQV